jgi:hypothetical protein
MKLTEILKTVLKEDTWGNNPSAAGGMSPGKTPNAVSPAPQPAVKFYDVAKDFAMFENTIEKEEAAASKTLEGTLKQNLVGKKVAARAGKGAVGQTEQDYTIDVVGASVTYMSEKFYIILKGGDGKDYYLNTAFKIKIMGPAETKAAASQPKQVPQPSVPVAKKAVGGIAYPQKMGMGSNNPSVGAPQ